MNTCLELHPTYIKLDDPPPDLDFMLTKEFSWEDSKAKYMLKRHRERVHKTPQKWCYVCRDQGVVSLYRDSCLPIGFEERLLELLAQWGVPYEVSDCRQSRPSCQYDWNFDFELRPYQQEIVDSVLDRQYGVVEAATGGGKTIVAAALVCALGVPTLILTPTKVVWQQWWSLFSEATNIPVGRLASGKYEDAPVQIAITKSLVNEDGSAKTQYLQDKQLLIVDEFHMGASKTWETIIKACPAYYRFGFSATPFRATDLECNMLTGMAGEVVAEIGTEELQDEGYLCQTDIKMIPVPCSYDRSIDDPTIPEGAKEPIGWRDTRYDERYRQGIVENVLRNLDIAEVVLHHYENGDKVLVIVSWTDHADILLPMLPDDTIYLSGKDSQKKTKDKVAEYKERQGGVLLGSPVVDVGFDVPACDVVVMAGGGSYEGRQRQRLGRGLRPSPGKDFVTVVDFMDDDRNTGGRPTFYQHSQARIRAYKSVGQDVTQYRDVESALRDAELTLGV